MNKIASVIIPTYQRADRLKNSINSVLKQDYPELEVLVIDDNNPESDWRNKTEKIMKSYAYDKRIKYIKHKKNKNGAAARNTGIKEALGNYIFFLDDDDIFLPGKITAQILFLERNNQFQAVYTGVLRNGRKNHPTLTGNLSLELLRLETEMYTPTLCFRRSILKNIQGFDESYRRHQDYELLLRFFKSGGRIGVISKAYVVLGRNEGENMLSAIDMEKTKKHFLLSFQPVISTFSKEEQEQIYCIHYFGLSLVFMKDKSVTKTLHYAYLSMCKSLFLFIKLICKRVSMQIHKGKK